MGNKQQSKHVSVKAYDNPNIPLIITALSLVSKTAFFHTQNVTKKQFCLFINIQSCVTDAHKLNIKLLYRFCKKQTKNIFFYVFQPSFPLRCKPTNLNLWHIVNTNLLYILFSVGFSTHFCSCHLYIVKKYIKYREILQVYSG